MNNIYSDQIVNIELSRLNSLIGTDGERDVQYDIAILKTALDKINADLLNGDKEYTIFEGNMWEECHNSLDKIVYHLNFKYDDSLSNYDYYQFAVRRAV